jgi:hypothetical protein
VLQRGSLSAGLRATQARDRKLSPPLDQTPCLLLSGYVEDVFQLLVHLADPVGRGHGQRIQECYGHGRVLAGPSKGLRWRTLVVDGGSNGSGPSSGFGEVNGGGSLCPQLGLMSVKLSQQSVKGCLLIDEFVEALGQLAARCRFPSRELMLTTPPGRLDVAWGSSIPGWRTVVRTMNVGLVWTAGVFSGASVTAMGSPRCILRGRGIQSSPSA